MLPTADNHRVVLKQEKTDYIHATFVNVSRYSHAVYCIIVTLPNDIYTQGYKHKKAFIIAQSPIENTVEDFWKMIVERECTAVVVLCALEEDGQVSKTSYIAKLCATP